MAVAMFKCVDMSTASEFNAFLGSAIPVHLDSFGSGADYSWLVFRKDFEVMYNYCMDAVPHYSGRVAFIGIDQNAADIGDQYKISLLSKMTSTKNRRELLAYYNYLVLDFTVAINNSHYMWEEVVTICERCMLGYILYDSVNAISKAVFTLSQGYSTPQEVAVFLDRLGNFAYDPDRVWNNLVNVMVHFCMLRLPKFWKTRRW